MVTAPGSGSVCILNKLDLLATFGNLVEVKAHCVKPQSVSAFVGFIERQAGYAIVKRKRLETDGAEIYLFLKE